ncbi:MAG TPA: DUF4340 domain-containing protein, partial [Myxococcaceae bacterium]|nr:DUF4340 domain-containing protein [Myxococcaceae bacterium]
MNAKQKNLMLLLVAAVAAGGLGLYAYFGVLEPEVKELERKEVDDRLFAVHAPGERGADGGEPPDPVFTSLSVEMQLPPSKTVVELVDGTWRVTSPVNALADSRTVELFTRALTSAKFKATVEENPTDEDLERYGLKTPGATVIVEAYVPDAQGGGRDDPKRQRKLTLHTGDENTFDGSLYLRREGDPRVYTAQGSLRASLIKHTHAWRDKTVFGLEEPSLRRIEVKTKQHAYTLERDAEGTWQVRQPVSLLADAEQVAKLVSSLAGAQALSFPNAEREPLVREAMEKPAVEAHFQPTSGEPLRLRITEVRVDKMNLVYALAERGQDIVLAEVSKHALSLLDLNPRELKNKKALSF